MIEASPPNTAARTVKQQVVTVDKKRKPELFCHPQTAAGARCWSS